MIIETMRIDGAVVHELARHLARAAATARFLRYRVDVPAVEAAVRTAAATAGTGRLRLLIDRNGSPAIQVAPLPAVPAAPVAVAVTPLPVDPRDWRLRHKTTDRDFYDAARQASGRFEVVFVTPAGAITEGSFTNVFVPAADGALRTPPATAGLLPGVLRATLLDSGRAIEAPLGVDDLSDGFLIGNAVRGLIRATLA